MAGLCPCPARSAPQGPGRTPTFALPSGLAAAVAGQASWEVLENKELDEVHKTRRLSSRVRAAYQ